VPLAARAQEDDPPTESPLLDMLAQIPDNSTARAEMLSYIDYDLVIQTRDGAAQPQNWAEFEAAREAVDDQPGRLMMAALSSIFSGPSRLIQYIFTIGPDMPASVGFDFFDIGQGIQFGTPPSYGIVLRGDFDPTRVAASFEAMGFTAEAQDNFTLICSDQGCDTGTEIDAQNRNVTNPFGGDLGRREPLLVSESYILNSPDFALAREMGAAAAGTTRTLAEQPDYRALALAATAEEQLIQLAIINSTLLLVQPGDPLGMMLGEQAVGADVTLEPTYISSIPGYTLVGFAHRTGMDAQYTDILMVYTEEADAETVAIEMPLRLEVAQSLRYRQPVSGLFEDRQMEMLEPQVVEADGRYVVQLTFRSPLPLRDKPEDDPFYQVSGLGYRMFIDMFMARDLGWLASDMVQYQLNVE
jgi:hypothetical protein